MKKTIIYMVFLFCFLNTSCIAQNKLIDSLLNQLGEINNDTSKLNLLNDIAWEYVYSNPDSALLFSNMAIKLSDKLLKNNSFKAFKLKLLKIQATSFNISGGSFCLKGNYPKTLKYYFKALRNDEAVNDKIGMAKRFGNIGIVYNALGDYTKALDYYSRALKIDTKLNNQSGMAYEMGSIGNLYNDLKQYQRALNFYQQAFEISEKTKNHALSATWLGNIANVFTFQGDSAIEKGNTNYAYSIKYPKALEFYLRALEIKQNEKFETDIAITIGNIGGLYTKMKKFGKAEEFLKKALAIDIQYGSIDGMKFRYEALSILYEKSGREKLALDYYKKFIEISDSINNEENTKKQTQLEMQYEFDKTQAADSIKNVEKAKQESIKHNQEIKQQKFYTYGGIAGFSLMLVVAIVSFRAFRNKQKANLIIAEQKNMVEEKQKEILDSIHYAKRIQQALLPSEKYFEKFFNAIKKQ